MNRSFLKILVSACVGFGCGYLFPKQASLASVQPSAVAVINTEAVQLPPNQGSKDFPQVILGRNSDSARVDSIIRIPTDVFGHISPRIALSGSGKLSEFIMDLLALDTETTELLNKKIFYFYQQLGLSDSKRVELITDDKGGEFFRVKANPVLMEEALSKLRSQLCLCFKEQTWKSEFLYHVLRNDPHTVSATGASYDVYITQAGDLGGKKLDYRFGWRLSDPLADGTPSATVFLSELASQRFPWFNQN